MTWHHLIHKGQIDFGWFGPTYEADVERANIKLSWHSTIDLSDGLKSLRTCFDREGRYETR